MKDTKYIYILLIIIVLIFGIGMHQSEKMKFECKMTGIEKGYSAEQLSIVCK